MLKWASIPITVTLSLSLTHGIALMITISIGIICFFLYWKFILRNYERIQSAPERRSTIDDLQPSLTTSLEEIIAREETLSMIELLKSVKLLSFLEVEILDQLGRTCEYVTYEANQEIPYSADILIVFKGSVKLLYNEDHLATKGPTSCISSNFDLLHHLLGRISGGVSGGVSTFGSASGMTGMEIIENQIKLISHASPSVILRIPKSAIIELTRSNPRSSNHLIYVLLTRIYKVTISVMQKYLGLDKEILELYKNLNKIMRLKESKLVAFIYLNGIKKTFQKNEQIHGNIATGNIGTGGPNGNLNSHHSLQTSNGLFLITEGTIQLGNGDNKSMEFGEEEFIGLFNSIIGSTFGNLFESKVTSNSASVLYISKQQFEKFLEENPNFISFFASILIRNSSLEFIFKLIDRALEWKHAKVGEIICEQGEEVNSIYQVLYGRLRMIKRNKNKNLQLINEFGAGDSIGDIEIATKTRWNGTTHAIRDTELIVIQNELLSLISRINLDANSMIWSRLLAQRLSRSKFDFELGDKQRITCNFKTITLLPYSLSDSSLVTHLALKLKNSISITDSCLLLDNSIIADKLGKYAFTAFGRLKLNEWLSQQEEENRLVIYLADSPKSPWTHLCISQADCIFIIVGGERGDEDDTSISPYEKTLFSTKSTARKELIFINSSSITSSSSNGRGSGGLNNQRNYFFGNQNQSRKSSMLSIGNWLKDRPWIQNHHVISMNCDYSNIASSIDDLVKGNSFSFYYQNRILPRLSLMAAPLLPNLPPKLMELWQILKYQLEKYNNFVKSVGVIPESALIFFRFIQERYGRSERFGNGGGIGREKYSISSDIEDDIERLTRRILGRGIGLVLGGGGARGLAHIGVIKAFREAGIPFDAIGGTSIGSLVGALYARDSDHYLTLINLKTFSERVSSYWRMFLDLTWPVTSWFTGHSFNRTLWKLFDSFMIEDMKLPYFCVTTDLSSSREVVHRFGYAWRYVRASMSLSGFLPPLCDQGRVLVDGGYLDNLPVVPMLTEWDWIQTVIAVDVSSDSQMLQVEYGDALSGFSVLLNRTIGKSMIPTLAEIQTRLAYVSCVSRLLLVKGMAEETRKNIENREEGKEPDVFYVRPPVANYGILDFGRWKDIVDVGYQYGISLLNQWKNDGTLDRIFSNINRNPIDHNIQDFNSKMSNSAIVNRRYSI